MKSFDIFQHADLIWALTQRDLTQKYRGSFLGFFWPFLTPLVLLGIYTIAFGVIMNISWGPEDAGLGGFAIMLFCGLIPFNFFNEVVSRSSQIIVASPNYVKRIAFPTEALPVVINISGTVHALISMAILMAGQLVMIGSVPWTVIFLPFVWIPLLFSALACSLLMSAIGVFIRDLPHIIGLVFSGLFFLTPIIYPAEAVPEALRFMLYINPIAFATSNIRQCLVHGLMPNWGTVVLFTVVSVIGFQLSAIYFNHIKGRFADVL
jgi:lipopolysaccharide transport system permease protein